jgi:hypothetical protein
VGCLPIRSSLNRRVESSFVIAPERGSQQLTLNASRRTFLFRQQALKKNRKQLVFFSLVDKFHEKA